MKRAIVLQHLHRESPGVIADACTARGLALEVRRLDRGDQVPRGLAATDLLVVMGGPMGIADLGSPRYTFLAQEVELLRRALGLGQPVLGVCLGAQLLAHAAGARVGPNLRRDTHGIDRPWPEVGFGEVRLLGATTEPVLAGLPSPLPVLHWHGDTFDLPAGAVRLAESEGCANQAFRLGKRAFGLQFHVEVDAPSVRAWAREDESFVKAALGPTGAAELAAGSEPGAAAMREPGRHLIDNLLAEMV